MTQDPVLSRVRNLVQKGWEETSDNGNYAQRKNELSVEDRSVLCGNLSSYYSRCRTGTSYGPTKFIVVILEFHG